MKNIESMEAEVVEMKQKTNSCRDKTLEKLEELYMLLKEENSEEQTVSAVAEVGSGGK